MVARLPVVNRLLSVVARSIREIRFNSLDAAEGREVHSLTDECAAGDNSPAALLFTALIQVKNRIRVLGRGVLLKNKLLLPTQQGSEGNETRRAEERREFPAKVGRVEVMGALSDWHKLPVPPNQSAPL